MSPRQPIGNKAMTSAQRIKRSRWINKFEETAIRLLDIINEAPDNLVRQPDLPVELVQKLIPYVRNVKTTGKVDSLPQSPQRFLKLGNGNQVNNKKKALKYAAYRIDAEIIDKSTLNCQDWGKCHLSAYTHPKGAMISTPNSPDQNFGGKEWHKKNHIILFRETLDGRCILYVAEISPLFNKRTIGHHGVPWKDIEDIALHREVMLTEDVIAEFEQI